MTGRRFGRLVVLKRFGSSPNGGARWLCKCDCGNEKVVDGVRLRDGETSSCGCLRAELARERFNNDPQIRKNRGQQERLFTDDGLPYSTVKKSKRNHTGVIGVSLDHTTGKWCARLMIHNRYVLLKRFNEFEAAVEA